MINTQKNIDTSKFLVSVIVPCYNQAEFLTEALESVWSQTYQHWECIIVDDGSPDDTAFIASKFCKLDLRFKYLKKENGGLSSARNAGIKEASGNWILPLDADDKIHPTYLQLAVNAFIDNPSLDLIYCKAEYFGAKTGDWILEPYSYQLLLVKNMIFCSAVFPSKIYFEAKGYNENLKNGWEDWDFWLNILNPSSQVLQIQETLFYYRIKKQSMVDQLMLDGYQKIKWDVFLSSASTYRKYFHPPMDAYAEVQLLKKNIQFYQQSKEYRLGRLLFAPVRFLKNLF
ncbi:MAG: glycosyltransferase family 2 protein [Janthinobacterium lividum]